MTVAHLFAPCVSLTVAPIMKRVSKDSRGLHLVTLTTPYDQQDWTVAADVIDRSATCQSNEGEEHARGRHFCKASKLWTCCIMEAMLESLRHGTRGVHRVLQHWCSVLVLAPSLMLHHLEAQCPEAIPK